MAQNKKPTKKYQPRSVIRDPLSFILRGNRPAPEKAQTNLKISYHMAMLRLTQGKGLKDDWQELANIINLTVILCEMGYGIDLVEEVVQAQASMLLLRERLKSTGRMTVRAEDMKTINNALSIHDEQIAIAPIRQMEMALRTVETQLARGNFVQVAPIAA